MKFALYIILIGLLDIIGTLSAKFFSINKNELYLAGTILSFALAGIFFALIMQYRSMAIANIIWMTLSIILITILDIFLFKEKITTTQFIGIILAMISVTLANSK